MGAFDCDCIENLMGRFEEERKLQNKEVTIVRMPRIYIILDCLDTVNELCRICTKYRDKFETDVVCGRYIVDGCSYLGLTSMLGHVVVIKPITDEKNDDFIMNLISIGAYTKE